MRNNNQRNKSELNNKSNKTISKPSKKINFKSIYNLYKTNFIDNCELIILEKQNNFLDKFFNKMKLIIKNEYDEDIFDKDKTLYEITKKCENDFISDVYWPMHDSCLKGYEKFKSSKNNNYFLSNFLSHCNYEQIALHSCGSKFIEIINNSNANEKLYALCTGCKKCYFNSLIPVYCPFAQKNYFTKIINEEEKNLPPATWEEYHCKNPKINEQMTCIECGDKFWIKKDKLFCKNCKLEVDPLLIIWTCTICKKEFKSNIKIYNPLENKEIDNSIKEAILYKKIVKPNDLPCKCIKNSEINNYDFCHKPNGQCKGILYFGNLKNEDILVCSQCNSYYKINNFLWNCPICRKKFKSENIIINNRNYNINNNDIISNTNSEKNKKSENLSENSEKNYLYLKYRGTPIRELNSYVKKKPDDYYNYSNLLNKNNINKNKRRNLSITYTNKNINKSNDIDNNLITEIEDNQNNNEKDYKYSTNNYYYLKNSNKRIKENNNNIVNNSEFLSPTKNDDFNEKKYSKIQLSTRLNKKYNKNDSKRYASTSTRNYNYNNFDEDNGETSITNFKEKKNLITNLKQKRNQKISFFDNLENKDFLNSEIYIPKKKLDLNKTNNLIPYVKEYNENNNNNDKINISNSVGIRERYKKVNRKINNFYEKRNLKTMLEENNDIKNNNNTSTSNNFYKKYKDISEIKNQINSDSKSNNDFYKEIRSSSQCKIDKDKFKNMYLDINNYKKNINQYSINEGLYTDRNKANENPTSLKHKYNKRNIGSKYIFNYNKIKINKDNSKNIYKRGTNNLYNKDKSGTNVSNGGDNILINNIITNNDNNIESIFNNKKKYNEENINSIKREKRNNINKNKKKKKKPIIQENKNQDELKNNNDINNNNENRNSFKNGANTIKEFDNVKKYKTLSNKDNITKSEKENENDE